jgi:hypothetical protein
VNTRFLLGLSCGVITGLVVVVACGDDSPQSIDAAPLECNCPAAEPPLAGRVVRVESRGDIAAIALGGAGLRCPPDGIPLGGSCSLVQLDGIEQVRLVTAGDPVEDSPTQWACTWFNESNALVTGVASLNCLMPAAQ